MRLKPVQIDMIFCRVTRPDAVWSKTKALFNTETNARKVVHSRRRSCVETWPPACFILLVHVYTTHQLVTLYQRPDKYEECRPTQRRTNMCMMWDSRESGEWGKAEPFPLLFGAGAKMCWNFVATGSESIFIRLCNERSRLPNLQWLSTLFEYSPAKGVQLCKDNRVTSFHFGRIVLKARISVQTVELYDMRLGRFLERTVIPQSRANPAENKSLHTQV